jgi:acetyltransferase
LPEHTEANTTKLDHVEEMLRDVRQSGRTILTEYESKKILAEYGIPTVDTRLAESVDEAIAQAEAIGYPVVLKLNSETITHKTDVGGVRLDLAQANEVRHAYETMEKTVTEKFSADDFLGVTVQPMLNLSEGYELIIGSSPDSQFGPVLLFGAGGTLVEVFKDRALGLPPLTTTLARRMMEQTKIYKALQGVRGREPVDLDRLEEIMVLFSQLVAEQRWIKEIDINPLLASSDELIALDARVMLYEPEIEEEDLPRLAIRPYPIQYIAPFTAEDGTDLVIRPIRPEDEPKMVDFHRSLSEQSVYLRYFRSFQFDQRVAHERLVRICFVDYDRDMVLVAERPAPDGEEDDIIGVGRLSKIYGTNDAEFALLINDDYQAKGIGTELLRRLLDIAREEGIDRVLAYLLQENRGMYQICKNLDFNFSREDDMIKAEIEV